MDRLKISSSVTSSGKPTVDWFVESDDMDRLKEIQKSMKEYAMSELERLYLETQKFRVK